MLLDDLKENDVIVFSDGCCANVTASNINKQVNIISIVLDRKVSGVRGYPKKFCWTYRLDGSLWNSSGYVNDIVKVIHA